jgi:uncharacterized protein (DUF58 family)
MPAVARLAELFARRPGAASEDPFDPKLFSRLDRMRLRVGRAHGARSGETAVRGLTQESGIEVESFKSYAPGDDIRYVDWNAAGRIDQLLTRRFVAEREVPVHLLVDASASMAVPAADRKFSFAVRLAAALAYIALNNNDPVRVALLREGATDRATSESGLLRHRGRYLRLKPLLSSATPAGRTLLREGITGYLERHAERGVALVISDFLVPPSSYEAALVALQARRMDVEAIHVIGGAERDVDRLGGRLLLRDAESGEVREVTLSASQRRSYASAFAARIEALRSFCLRAGVGYASVDSGAGLEHCLTRILSVAGLLRMR